VSVDSGEAGIIAQALGEAKALLESDRADELRQLELLDPPTPEELQEAREKLGFGAGHMAVLREARENRRSGRPLGARNKRTDDFAKWLLSQGRHPAGFMMEVVNTPIEVLMAASGKPYLECLDRKIRCAEGLMPFLESKKPVGVDMTIRGVRVVEEAPRDPAQALIEGEIIRVARDFEEGGEA
jgi:hypothetical protein